MKTETDCKYLGAQILFYACGYSVRFRRGSEMFKAEMTTA